LSASVANESRRSVVGLGSPSASCGFFSDFLFLVECLVLEEVEAPQLRKTLVASVNFLNFSELRI
jgi:hypothetical protein